MPGIQLIRPVQRYPSSVQKDPDSYKTIPAQYKTITTWYKNILVQDRIPGIQLEKQPSSVLKYPVCKLSTETGTRSSALVPEYPSSVQTLGYKNIPAHSPWSQVVV
eukprot:2842795-Rhodomonas_salina.2